MLLKANSVHLLQPYCVKIPPMRLLLSVQREKYESEKQLLACCPGQRHQCAADLEADQVAAVSVLPLGSQDVRSCAIADVTKLVGQGLELLCHAQLVTTQASKRAGAHADVLCHTSNTICTIVRS